MGMTFDQRHFDVRCEWGKHGIEQLAPVSSVVSIVDVPSFSTCIDIANGQRATVFPYQWQGASAQGFAQSMKAELATQRGSRYSLSPMSLMYIREGTRLVLPSPNGSSLSLATGATPTLTGYLRNARATKRPLSLIRGAIQI